MNEEFNMSMRKFLKKVGVTSQQEIEKKLRQAKEDGKLPAGPLKAHMVLTIDGIDMEHIVEGEIRTGDEA